MNSEVKSSFTLALISLTKDGAANGTTLEEEANFLEADIFYSI